jgi:hypothetical protein
MALPVSSSGSPPDVAVQGWAAITVQVAWTLRSLGVRPRRVLREARDHVLFHLDPSLGLALAEDRAAYLTRAFVAHTRGQLVDARWAQDLAMPPSARWRRAIEESADPVTAAVFRHHYGAGIAIDRLANELRIERLTLEGARAGLRATVRRIALEDDLPVQGWSDERIDRQIARLAAFSPYDSPPLLEVAEGCHVDWVPRCPRCERTLRLVRAGAIGTEDLEPPVGAARPTSRLSVLAIHVHPDGRRHLPVLVRELGGRVQRFGDDLVLVEALPKRVDVVRLAAEVGAPARHHLRAVVVEGPGRWSSFGVLGPLVEEAVTALRGVPWGTIGADEELPEELPPPPSARWAWLGVAGLAAAVAVALIAGVAVTGRAPPSDVDLDVEFTAARDGVWSRFTTSEPAQIVLARQVGERVEVVLASSSPADKAVYATGDGSYLLHTEGDRVLLAAGVHPFHALDEAVRAATASDAPLDVLAELLRAQQPGAALAVSR